MTYHIYIQQAGDASLSPAPSLLKRWAKQVLREYIEDAELTIRLVGIPEMTTLNEHYRKQQGPTNVLSFPFNMPEHFAHLTPHLGDIVICSEVVNQEAKEHEKSSEGYWAHVMVHGIFHLLGYDHQTDEEAMIMESLEAKAMIGLGFDDPYSSSAEI